MRVWIDVSNSPQVPFFRPLIALLESRGHEVEVTTRDYAQTLELLALHSIPHEVVGPRHGGARALAKVRAMAGRLRALRRYGAVARSTSRWPTPRTSFRSPRARSGSSAYAFDYEFARVQHGLGCRAATRVVVPDAIPQERLDALGARARKVRRYPGLKEEYYLAGFAPDAAALELLGLDLAVLVVVRTARGLALPPPRQPALRRRAAPPRRRSGGAGGRPPSHRGAAGIERLALPSLVVPDRAVDARSLVALADLVVSARGR